MAKEHSSTKRAAAWEAFDELENKLAQLGSLLTSMYGVGADGFEDIGPEHRDNLVWLAATLAREARDLSQAAWGAA